MTLFYINEVIRIFMFYQSKIEKLARQISVLETSVTENKNAADIKEKAVR